MGTGSAGGTRNARIYLQFKNVCGFFFLVKMPVCGLVANPAIAVWHLAGLT